MTNLSFIRLLVIVALASTTCVGRAAANDNQVQLKAAIVYNILRYTQFDSLKQANELNLCLSQNSPLSAALAKLDGRKVGQNTLRVRPLEQESIATQCDAVFLNEAVQGRSGFEVPRSVMSIGEVDDFMAQGGTVRLFNFGRQIRFEVNPDKGAQAGIKFSSKLLRLARIVRD